MKWESLELSDYERTVFRHAANVPGVFQKLSFLGRYLDNKRIYELSGVDVHMNLFHRYLQEEITPPQYASDLHYYCPAKDRAAEFVDIFFEKKRGQEQTPSPPQNIMSGAR